MKKLIEGIAEFRRTVQPAYRERFAHLALGQKPDCLFIACSDSRVVPNLFASTEPGDLFVVRNVGALVPPCGPDGRSTADLSEAAAIEFAVRALGVGDIVVCGHSDCGAMKVILSGQEPAGAPNLHDWLDVGRRGLGRMSEPGCVGEGLSDENRLSQLSVLQQIDHLRTYPAVAEAVARGAMRLHAWWFDLAHAEVLRFDEVRGRFVVIGDEGGSNG